MRSLLAVALLLLGCGGASAPAYAPVTMGDTPNPAPDPTAPGLPPPPLPPPPPPRGDRGELRGCTRPPGTP